MMITITRKIQLLFDCEKSELKAMYEKWYNWQHIVHRAANWIATNHYIQDNVKDLFYFTDDVKVKLGDVKKDADGILTMSRDNTTYQVLSKAFKGECPMGMLSGLNMVIASTYKKESQDVRYGKKSLRTYRGNIPMPVRRGDIANFEKLEDGNYRFHVYGTWFKTWFGKDLSGNELIMDMAMDGKYKLCDSSISIRKNKIFFNAVFSFEKQDVKLDKDREMIVRLSANAPLEFSFRQNDYTIGDRMEYEHRLEQIRRARQRAVISSRYNKKGKGRKKRLEHVDRYTDYALNYINNRLHNYTAKLIDFALKLKCGTITLAPVDDALAETYVFPAWSYNGLSDKLKYKCAKFGIELHGVDKKAKKEAVPQ